ncbi:MAG: ribulose-phosphate 3-epimerase [Ktedonobacteraceae bacterium]
MVGIVPSILSADLTRLDEQIREAETVGAARFQIDVMDGHFVPAITVGPMVIEAVRRCTHLPLEAHLMISNPENSIEACVKAGSDIIIVHQESTLHLHRVIQQIKEAGKMVGVALLPSTPALLLEDVLPLLDMVVIMTVNPGFDDQKFIPDMVPKIARVHQMITQQSLKCDIEADGRIDETTVWQVVEAGANMVVTGSALYNKRESVKAAMKRLVAKTL